MKRILLRFACLASVVALTLGSECDPKGVDFFLGGLTGGAAQPGNLTGTVTVAEGTGAPQPQSGVGVTLRRGGATVGTASTNAQGDYSFNNLDPATYSAGIVAPTGATCPQNPRDVVVPAGQTVRADFACTRPAQPTTGSLTVTVTSGGSPLPGVSVAISGPGGTSTGTTGANGSFTFTNLAPGSYSASTTVSGQSCPAQTANVTAGQTASATIPCTPSTGTLIVTVTSGGSPLSGASVGISGPGGASTGTTGANGSVTFGNLQPGSYSVSATVSGQDCQPQTANVVAGQTANATIPCTPALSGAQIASLTYSNQGTMTQNTCPAGFFPPVGQTFTNPGPIMVQSRMSGGQTFVTVESDADVDGVLNVQTGAWNGTGDVTLSGSFFLRETISGGRWQRQTNGSVLYNSAGRITFEIIDASSGSEFCRAVAEPFSFMSLGTLSSRRFKQDVRALLPGGVALLGLRPVAFRYRAPYGDPRAVRVGLIAEEVARAFPQSVARDGRGRPVAIDYGTLSALVMGELGTWMRDAVRSGIAQLVEPAP